MKSSLRSDEICGVPPQMKLNPSLSPDEVGFHHEVISSTAGGFIPSDEAEVSMIYRLRDMKYGAAV